MSKQSIGIPEAVRRLPPLPQVLAKALALARDPRSRRSDLARVLALDQGMTGYFLFMVNSAYFGLPRRITSIDEAIGYLGFDTVEQVILALAASDTLSQAVPSYLMEREALWRHSVAVAEGADWIAKGHRIGQPSEAYVAGLLHDVGKLGVDVLLHRLPDWHEAEAEEAEEAEPVAWTAVERREVGSDHAAIGALMVRSWNLPDRVVEAVACHHDLTQAELDPRFAATVHLANVAALMAGIGLGVDGLRYALDESAIALLEWGEEDMMALVEQMEPAVQRAEQMLRVKV
jgi:putative nucleotidyltransferase with HDIG domain